MEDSDLLTKSQKLRINNKRVLTVTTVLFGIFVIAEILGALVRTLRAQLIISLYLTNLYATDKWIFIFAWRCFCHECGRVLGKRVTSIRTANGLYMQYSSCC